MTRDETVFSSRLSLIRFYTKMMIGREEAWDDSDNKNDPLDSPWRGTRPWTDKERRFLRLIMTVTPLGSN